MIEMLRTRGRDAAANSELITRIKVIYYLNQFLIYVIELCSIIWMFLKALKSMLEELLQMLSFEAEETIQGGSYQTFRSHLGKTDDLLAKLMQNPEYVVWSFQIWWIFEPQSDKFMILLEKKILSIILNFRFLAVWMMIKWSFPLPKLKIILFSSSHPSFLHYSFRKNTLKIYTPLDLL